MFKKLVSKILLILFLGFLATPSTILIVDSSFDVSIFYGIGNEKEEKVNEKNIEIELLLNNVGENEFAIDKSQVQNRIDYLFKKYTKPHLNLILPPPDLLYS